MIRRNLLLLMMLSIASLSWAQTVVSGKVTDGASNQGIAGASVRIKDKTIGTVTDRDGNFSLKTSQAVPFTLVVTSVGFGKKEIEIQTAQASGLVVTLEESSILTDEVVVSASRVEESLTKAAVTVEKVGIRQLQQSPAASPFDALQNLKGVDLLTQSLSFKSVNVRGFGANNNNRFVQLTDGMDNRSPGLGFGFGGVAGISDLDIESMEILPGASSALYGPDALQGLQLTRSKNPFEFQGFSAMVKLGINNVGSSLGAKPYTDVALRYAKQIGNKLAFKINFQQLNGTDFVADDYSDRSHRDRLGFWTTDASRGGVATAVGFVPNSDPNTNFRYDGLNIYGDDFNNGNSSLTFGTGATVPAALRGQLVTRPGYTELALLRNDGKVFNTRANVSVHYKLTDKIQASLGWYYGNGNFIQTGGNRTYFPDYIRNQFKLELSADNFFLRAYTTQQTAEGINLAQTAYAINNAFKSTATWGADFATAYAANGGNIGAARATAGQFAAGSSDFLRVWDAITSTNNNIRTGILPQGGTLGIFGSKVLDNSDMWHYEGMYNFKNQIKFAEVLVGASLRKFYLSSAGTSFPTRDNTPTGQEYTVTEYGAYAQVSKDLKLSDKLSVKPTVAVRYDKNEYFDGGFTPRASVVASLGQHNFRGSWQSAFRNPAPAQLFAIPAVTGGQVGGARLAAEAANLFSNPAYLQVDINDFLAGRIDQATLQTRAYNPSNFTTEKIATWEVGYKTLINNKLFVDAFYFSSKYSDFIAAQNFAQPLNGSIADFRPGGSGSRPLQINFNNFNEIFVTGFGFGLEYVLPKGYALSGNFANQVGRITLRDAQGNVIKDRAGNEIVKARMSDPNVAQVGRNFFISPENRYNISFGNPKVTKQLGFNVTYRWTDKMWVEQGQTAGDIWLPSWNTFDAQVSYKVPAIKSVIKLGGANIFNKYYAQGYGIARIGGLYYVSLNFDELLR